MHPFPTWKTQFEDANLDHGPTSGKNVSNSPSRDTCSSLQGGYDYPSHHAAAGHQVEIDGVYISEAGESQTEDRADEAVNI